MKQWQEREAEKREPEKQKRSGSSKPIYKLFKQRALSRAVKEMPSASGESLDV